MAFAFGTDSMLKGVNRIWPMTSAPAPGFGVGVAVLVFLVARPIIDRQACEIGNSKEGVNRLFTVPLNLCGGAAELRARLERCCKRRWSLGGDRRGDGQGDG
jgi:hypothetical protein